MCLLPDSLLLRFKPAVPESPSHLFPDAGPYFPPDLLNQNLKLFRNQHFNNTQGASSHSDRWKHDWVLV